MVDDKKKERLVLTPGGYRPEGSVKHVNTNEAVKFNEDGSYVIVPREVEKSRSKRPE
jgi:hypothetical protein